LRLEKTWLLKGILYILRSPQEDGKLANSATASSVNNGLTVPNHPMRLPQPVLDEVWASILSKALRLYWSLTKTGSLKDYKPGKKSTIPPELVDALRTFIESITQRLDVYTL
jgi:hypothetical protein